MNPDRRAGAALTLTGRDALGASRFEAGAVPTLSNRGGAAPLSILTAFVGNRPAGR